MAEDLRNVFTVLRPEDFRQHVPIGRGKDSVIYAAHCDKLGGQVAVKVYSKDRTSASKLRAIKREAAMMVYLSKKSVPAITSYYGAFQDSKHIYIVMEYCARGDLLERLLSEGRAFSEARVCDVATALLTVLQRMHALGVIHRDVKLENIFIGAGEELKLGDFGLTMSMKQELAISPVGTVEYMAPEVVALPPVEMVSKGLIDPHAIAACTEKVDIWALGITLYELLTGHLPFDGRDKEEIKRAITLGRMRALPPHLSSDCVAFISDMLESDPETRPSAAQLLRHPYIARHSSRGIDGSRGADGARLAPIADATAYITSSWGVAAAADGGKPSCPPSPPSSRSSMIPPGFGTGAGKPAGWRDVRPAAPPSPQQAQAGFRPPLQPTVNGAPPLGPPSPPQKRGGPYRSSESEWPSQERRRGDIVYPRDGLQFGLTDSPAGPMTMRRAGSGTTITAPPLTPQPPPQQSRATVAAQRLTSHSSFGSVSFYNAEAETPAHAAVAGELIRARHWELDRPSPGVSGCSSPAQGSPARPAPGKAAAGMLRVSSRDILAPYSPLASKSVRGVGGLTLEVGASVDEDNMLSWRHGDRRSEGGLPEDALPWSPTRLLQKSFWQTWFKTTSPTVQAH